MWVLGKLHCAICFGTSNRTGYIRTSCNHVFHRQCFEGWRRDQDSVSCPYCRTQLGRKRGTGRRNQEEQWDWSKISYEGFDEVSFSLNDPRGKGTLSRKRKARSVSPARTQSSSLVDEEEGGEDLNDDEELLPVDGDESNYNRDGSSFANVRLIEQLKSSREHAKHLDEQLTHTLDMLGRAEERERQLMDRVYKTKKDLEKRQEWMDRDKAKYEHDKENHKKKVEKLKKEKEELRMNLEGKKRECENLAIAGESIKSELNDCRIKHARAEENFREATGHMEEATESVHRADRQRNEWRKKSNKQEARIKQLEVELSEARASLAQNNTTQRKIPGSVVDTPSSKPRIVPSGTSQSAFASTSRYTLSDGDDLQGDTLIGCTDDPDVDSFVAPLPRPKPKQEWDTDVFEIKDEEIEEIWPPVKRKRTDGYFINDSMAPLAMPGGINSASTPLGSRRYVDKHMPKAREPHPDDPAFARGVKPGSKNPGGALQLGMRNKKKINY